MYRKLPPLHALAAFEAAARHQSFAKAAEELFLTHSAISHRIKLLEQSLGAKLFLRLNRNVQLTAAGTAFLDTVRDALGKLQTASSELGASGRMSLRVSIAPALASHWLAPRIGAFQEKNPGLDIDFQSSSQLLSLRGSSVDIGIRFGAGHWQGCHSVRIFEDALIPVCSPLYLEKHGRPKRPSDLTGAVLLRHSRFPWKPWFRAAGLDWEEPTSGPTFNEVSLLLDAAAHGAGIALAGRVLTAAAQRAGNLVSLFEFTSSPDGAYHAVCVPEKLQRPEVALFIDWLIAEAKEDAFKGAEEQIRAGSAQSIVMVENLPAGAIYVESGRITFNRAAEEITGYPRSEIRTLDEWFEKLYGAHGARARQRYEADHTRGVPVIRSGEIRRKDGTHRHVEFSSFVYPRGEVWLMNDITERTLTEERRQELARNDRFTGLPNKISFVEQLRHALARARHRRESLGVLAVELSPIDDLHGAGHAWEHDEDIAREIASGLRACLRDFDIVGRLSSDRFAVAMEEPLGPASLRYRANRLRDALSRPFGAKGSNVKFTPRIGMAMFPTDADDPDTLLKIADSRTLEIAARPLRRPRLRKR